MIHLPQLTVAIGIFDGDDLEQTVNHGLTIAAA